MYRFQIVLVNRLILNLSHAANPSEDSELRTRTKLVPPTYAVGTFLGNIGGPVRSLPDEFYDDEFGEDVVKDNEDVQPDRGEGVVSALEHNTAIFSSGIEEICV